MPLADAIFTPGYPQPIPNPGQAIPRHHRISAGLTRRYGCRTRDFDFLPHVDKGRIGDAVVFRQLLPSGAVPGCNLGQVISLDHGVHCFRGGRWFRREEFFHRLPEIVHSHAELRQPVVGIAVVGAVALRMRLFVADDTGHREIELPAQIGAVFLCRLDDRLKIPFVGQAVLTHLELDMTGGVIVVTAFAAAAHTPTRHIIGQGVDYGHIPVLVLADEGMYHLLRAALIPVVAVLVFTQFCLTIHVPLQVGVIGPGAVYHDPLGGHAFSFDIAGVLRLMTGNDFHDVSSLFTFR